MKGTVPVLNYVTESRIAYRNYSDYESLSIHQFVLFVLELTRIFIVFSAAHPFDIALRS